MFQTSVRDCTRLPEMRCSQLPQVLVTYRARMGSLGFDDHLGKRVIIDGEWSWLWNLEILKTNYLHQMEELIIYFFFHCCMDQVWFIMARRIIIAKQQNLFCLTAGFMGVCLLALKWFRLLNKMPTAMSILKKNYWNVGNGDSKEEEI